jgi:putative phosphoesterase
MRIAILADIHGNLPALEAVTADIDKQSPDQIWCGGDLGWLGPWAAECVSYVRSAGWPTVKGNTDVWLTGDPQTVSDESERKVNIGIAGAHAIPEDDARWLMSLPVGHTGPASLLMVHGTPGSPFTAPFPDDPVADFAPYEGQAALVVYGHVHIGFVKRLPDGTIVANPGSVGLPADGIAASYMLLDHQGGDWTIRHRRVDYDRDSALAGAKEMGGPAGERFTSLLGP